MFLSIKVVVKITSSMLNCFDDIHPTNFDCPAARHLDLRQLQDPSTTMLEEVKILMPELMQPLLSFVRCLARRVWPLPNIREKCRQVKESMEISNISSSMQPLLLRHPEDLKYLRLLCLDSILLRATLSLVTLDSATLRPPKLPKQALQQRIRQFLRLELVPAMMFSLRDPLRSRDPSP